MKTSHNRFEGDGRRTLTALPRDVHKGTRPLKVRRSQARSQCERFDANGFSNHSAMGGTLWVILEHCRRNKIRYAIHEGHRMGYYVEKLK